MAHLKAFLPCNLRFYIANRLKKASNTTEKRDISIPGSQAKLHYLDQKSTTSRIFRIFRLLEIDHRGSFHRLCPRFSTTAPCINSTENAFPFGTVFSRPTSPLSPLAQARTPLDWVEHEEEEETDKLHGKRLPLGNGFLLSHVGPKPEHHYTGWKWTREGGGG